MVINPHHQLTIFIILDQATQHSAPGTPLPAASSALNLRRTQRRLHGHMLVFGRQLRLGVRPRLRQSYATGG